MISGIVIEASSGDPVRKAIVTATWHGTPRSWATARTDGSGRFIFEGLPAGKYDLHATKQGIGTAIYGANSVRELGDVLTLGDGETHGDIKLRFLRSASISGRVVDVDGDPLASVSVSLLRPARNLGERTLMNYQGAQTNDRGEYKITAIDPGEYYLRCIPNIFFMGPMIRRAEAAEPVARVMLVPQYFGGARDTKDASPLILRGGDILTGIDFHLMAERPARIVGQITGVPPMDTVPNPMNLGFRNGRLFFGAGEAVNVDLIPSDENQSSGSTGTGVSAPDYRFEMPESAPGRYRIQANVRARDKTYYASQLIDAHEGANEVVLAMAPALEVKGHLKVEGPGAHPAETLTIVLAGPGAGGRANYSAQVKKDGSFSLEEVPAGEWLININPNPAGMFEKSVSLGDKNFLYKRIEIPPGSDAPLNIVLSSNTATVSGEIDAGGADGKRAGILLEPIGPRHMLTRFYYAATSDDSGKFKMTGIAPGKYKIFALEQIATVSYRNPEAGDLLEAALKELAEELEVPEGGTLESHPKLIPEERAKEILKP